MLFKLSMSGLKSKLQDYTVLLLGLIISISIFYMFQTLAQNKAFLESNTQMPAIVFAFQIGSVLLAIITFFYILYANSFLLSLRQKEFGMYMMLGAKKHKVTLLMFIETIVLGAASLVIGITIGVGLAEGIGQLLMKQLEFSGEGYQVFYIPSMTVTCIFFFALFVLSAIMNSMKLSRISVLQLVHADAQTERVAVKGKMTAVVAFLGLILLGIGYASLIYISQLQGDDILKTPTFMAIGLIAATVGTYMLFGSLLPVMVKKVQSNKKRREKGLNAFTFAQLNFRINSLTNVLATVAILVALGAGGIACGMAFKNDVLKQTDKGTIYDSVVHNPTVEKKKLLDGIPFKEKLEYRYKVDDRYVYYIKEELENNRPLVKDRKTEKTIKVSEKIPMNSFALSRQWGKDDGKPKQWSDAFQTIQPEYMYPNHEVKIVNQNIYDNMKGTENTVFIGKTDNFGAYLKEWKKLDELQVVKYKNVKAEELGSKYQTYKWNQSFSSGLMFMGFFVGIAFLAMMASCLMFKVLSGASKDLTRYQMLRKIGVRRELLTQSIYKELFFVFLVPAIVGIVHVLVGMNMFSPLLIDPYFRIWLPLVIFVVIYSMYYLITVQLYKGIVLPKKD
ncbi:FtsX-like permease family protein [Bacillus toyonensis]|uniref:FtsX-like permease family protein n=1 Tax=Bacillus toyonensis TaxID=155322 RepID=UPI000307E3C0|nr:ABC transporter permease [Bacillus toyonensis]OTX10183.1 ABC transporter permease [Bacillus thuringiensis serovar seoulensis]MCA1045778.1 ABC transporter permease [Bacillus toyonensis]MDO8160650.1 ABC transporter permease [Bacillus toyonensis]MED3197812.1 ABC transporter permease [Bacillus toyonensis]QQN81670.1 ABC transporter permease [Bacillus toyonensis]